MTIGRLRSMPCKASATTSSTGRKPAPAQAATGPPALAPRHLGKLRPHRPRAERRDADPGPVQLAAQRFGKTGHVGLGRCVDRKVRDRQEARRRADVQNRAALARDHAGQQRARQARQRHHVDQHHVIDLLRVGGGERSEIAEPGVVDQKIDREVLRRRPRRSTHSTASCCDKSVGRISTCKLGCRADQLRAQFLQSLLAPRDQDERAPRVRASCRANSRPMPAEAPVMSAWQPSSRIMIRFFVRSGSSTRQTFSATIL